MTTADLTNAAHGQRLLTIADVAALPRDLPSGPVDFELDNGALVMMTPAGDLHGAMQARISAELLIQGERRGLGKAYSEVGIVLWRNPDRLVAPDAAFIAAKSLPARTSPEGYLETIPELIVEIRSKNDSIAQLERKIEDYLRAGVECAWLIDPAAKTATIHGAGAIRRLGPQEMLEAAGLPGLAVSLADLFRE